MDWGLFLHSSFPVLETGLMAGCGVLLAKQGVLDARGRQALSQTVFWCFIPALTFTKLASAVDLNQLRIWWSLPANVAMGVLIGLLVGWAATNLLRVPDHLRYIVLCASALGNVGNLPIVIVQGVCADGSSMFQAAFPGLQCAETGIAMVAFGMWVGGFCQFSIAYHLLKPDDPAEHGHQEQEYEEVGSNGGLEMQERREDKHRGAANGGAHVALDMNGAGPSERDEAKRERRSTMIMSPRQALLSSQITSTPEWQQECKEAAEAVADDSVSLVGRGSDALDFREEQPKAIVRHCLALLPWAASFMNLPNTSAFIGLAFGCIVPVKALLYGSNPPLGFVRDALDTLAGGMIPCVMLVLGSVLHKGPGNAKLPLSLILSLIAIRLFIIPITALGMVTALIKLRVFPAPDPLFLFVLLISNTTPTAINLQTVATLHRHPAEHELSTLLFWEYMASIITIPIWIVIYLLIIPVLVL